ncbi:MAG TPA: anti-sigma regulatory factor [Gemmatimonadales bacterium]|nr:anti-sigma regulatory factor [Gemmatimonadales bacterium]
MSPLFAGDSPDTRDSASQSVQFSLSDASRVGEARRVAVGFGARAGLSGNALSDLGIVVTEIAGNAVRYAGRGEILLRPVVRNGRPGVEVLCIDRGPGMANVAECMRDGYSTAGTMGTGLGAARRLAHHFDIHSTPEHGTGIVARIWLGGPPEAADGTAEIGAVCLPVAGETASGDGWAALTRPARTALLVVDGLGHGINAAAAADRARDHFSRNAARAPGEILSILHDALRATRGAAAAVASIDLKSRELRYAAVGNIAGRLLAAGRTRALISSNGIVGHQANRGREFTYPWTDDSMLVMHSDGIRNQWKPELYPGLLQRDAALLAGVLFRDFMRDRDDIVVLTCRHRAGAGPASSGSDRAS